MPWHSYIIRPQSIHIQGENTRRLRPIDHKWHSKVSTKAAHFLDRQNITKHIGYMGKYRHICSAAQGSLKVLQCIFPVKQVPSGYLHAGSQ